MIVIPQLTLAFSVMKIAATTLGETAGDLFSMTLHFGYAVTSIILLVLFLVIPHRTAPRPPLPSVPVLGRDPGHQYRRHDDV